MTHDEKLKVARTWMKDIRREFDEIEDLFAHAAGFRGESFLTDLMRAYQSAESAKIVAFQYAIRKVHS